MPWMIAVTAIWIVLALGYPFLHEGFGRFYFGSSALGETGDFLTGWFTPLAFIWFVFAVFLQRKELANQRKELELMRKEYAQSREVSKEQASHLKQSSIVGARQVFMKMLDDATLSLTFSAYRIQRQLPTGGSMQSRDDFKSFLDGNDRQILDNTVKVLHALCEAGDTLERTRSSMAIGKWGIFIQLLEVMVHRHEELKGEAEKVQLLDYYMYIHQSTLAGEMVNCASLILHKANALEQPN
jgi:hypothetical protein